MRPVRGYPLLKLLPGLILAFGVTALAVADETKKPELPPALTKAAPESVEDLKAIQEQVRKVLDKVIPATVGVRIGPSSGSGVIIDKEGHVLTAGHVSGAPGRDCTLILQNGKTVKGKTLGNNRGIDSGLIKIIDKGDWPCVEMGNSADLQKGQWVIATGHPGGFKPGRSPVVRLGRVLSASKSVVTTDCTLVGGDSGGPLFDMHGKVVGIHSRIGGSIASNMHVPVDTYRDTWDRLAKSDAIGKPDSEAYLGVEPDPDSKECRISNVLPDSAAEKGGMKVGDVILAFEGQKVTGLEDLRGLILKKKPNDLVAIEVRRGDETVTLKIKLGQR